MADTDAMRKDFEQWKRESGVVGGGTLLDRIYFAGWQKGKSRALASRPAEVDGSPVDQACARVRRAEAELKAARKALMDVMTTAARTDE